MATGMKDLVDRDCGGVNPLMKLASHALRDQAFKDVARPGIINGSASLPLGEASANNLVSEFLSEQRIGRPLAPTSFHMDDILREMRSIEDGGATNWKQAQHDPEGSSWAAQYLEGATNGVEGAQSQQKMLASDWSADFNQWQTGAKDPSDQWAGDYLTQSEHVTWVEELNQQFDGKMWLTSDPGAAMEEGAGGDGLSVQGKGAADVLQHATDQGVPEEWIDDFESCVDAEFWNNMQRQWEQGMAGNGESFHPWLNDFDGYQGNAYQEYKFEEENALRDHPDPFREGLDRLKRGDIPNAVLLFEAAAQNNPDRAEAWQYLGTTQADNEQDPASIAALVRCLELDHGNLTALLSLAVSYTNELRPQLAYESLIRWLRSNPRYAHLVPQGEQTEPHYALVKDLFLAAVHERSQDVNDPIDADVQTCLGVLFNISAEYKNAVDCFTAALQVRPEDWLLWNKLGATLANGNRSEESVEAYHNALRLSPGYVRTRYNLGIACINLQAHRQAAEHFLTALGLQRASQSPGGVAAATPRSVAIMSSNIWSTLRMTLTLLGRSDLHTACDRQDLDLLARELNVDI